VLAASSRDGAADRREDRSAENDDMGFEDDKEIQAMLSELRDMGDSRLGGESDEVDAAPEEDALEESGGSDVLDEAQDDEDVAVVDDEIDVSGVVRSGQVSVLGVPNSGKSSLVNALVGSKVSIISPKPQTTRQKILGLALVSPKPGMQPTTQAVFCDTAGIMNLNEAPDLGGWKKGKKKRMFRQNVLHKAMVRTAWKSVRQADEMLWVLDGWKCYRYGDYIPSTPMLDGIAIGPEVRDAWWTHPEMEDELAFFRRIRGLNRPVNVVLNKMDLIAKVGFDVEQFAAVMRERLTEDLGKDAEGKPLLQNLWPTSALKDPQSLEPIQAFLCEALPEREPLFPLDAVSDVPARVAASEVTREKLFSVLEQEVPYAITVINAVWREQPDGTLLLGQRVVVMTEGQERIVRAKLKAITESAEEEISESINFGRPVRLHFQTFVDKKWIEKQEYYEDVQGLLTHGPALIYRESA